MSAFKPGQSGNPGGRPREVREVLAAAREPTEEAIERLAYWMRSDNPKASPAACIALLNRAWGQPTQSHEIEGRLTLEALVLGAISKEEREAAAQRTLTIEGEAMLTPVSVDLAPHGFAPCFDIKTTG